MAKTIAKNGLILIGGYSLSSMASSYDIEYSANPVEVTGFTDGWKNYIPTIFSGQMSLNMYWNSTTSTNAALQTLAKRHVTISPTGSTVGSDCFTMYADHAAFTPTAEASGVLSVGSVVFQGSGVDSGPLPAHLLQHATITNTASSASVRDPSAGAVTQRCAAVLHIWTACAADTYSVIVEHSANDVAWATLLTFTANGSAITSEMQVAASGTINQYRRVTATRTGAAGNNFGFSVAFWHGGF